MPRYAIFRYREFPKQTAKDTRIKIYLSQKQTIQEAIKMNQEAGLYGSRFYWRELEENEK